MENDALSQLNGSRPVQPAMPPVVNGGGMMTEGMSLEQMAVQQVQAMAGASGQMNGAMGAGMPGQMGPGMSGQMVATTPETAGPVTRSSGGGLIKTIIIILLGLSTATFVGLFVWMAMQYNEVRTDVDGQIKLAVDAAVDENTMAMEMEFAEREKDPYRDFAGPADYGELSFKYPKTWSLYVARDAANGGDYEAYFNPIEVNTVSNKTINALRLTIRSAAFDTVVAQYQNYVTQAILSVQSVTVAGTAANRYTGGIPGSELEGVVVIFKIRDKTAILQTDSMLFEPDFNRLLTTVRFNA